MTWFMDIEFEDAQIALLETDAAVDAHLPVAVIQAARHRFSIVRAAPDMRTLHGWKSLSLMPPEGSGDYLLPLSGHWVIVIRIIEKNSVMTVVVVRLEEQLRGAA